MGWLQRAALKLLSPEDLRHPGGSIVHFGLAKQSTEQMAREIGDGTSSDLLMTPVRWLQRAMPEAPVVEVDDDGEPAPSELQALLETPNPFYSFELLLSATVFSLSLEGNAYWIRVKSANERDVELWWAPTSTISPKFPIDGSTFISHYEYNPGGTPTDLDVEDVVHFREGVDPANIRLGLSPIRGLLREIWTDNEAADFTASLLKNGGVPGLVLSPSSPDYTITQPEADAAKSVLRTEHTRHRRGEPVVFTGPIKLEQFGYSPQQLDLSPLRNVSEERVCAAIGVPAAVVGFGAGLQQTKVGATMRELRQLAWWNAVIPLQRIISGEINRALAPTFDSEGVMFDNSAVAALRENADSVAMRADRLVRAGIMTRAEAKRTLGLDALPADDVYLMPLSTMVVPAGEMPDDASNGQTTPDDEDDDPKGAVVAVYDGGREVPFEDIGNGFVRVLKEVARRPSVRTLPPVLREFADRFDGIRERAANIYASLVTPVFEELGREAERIVRRLGGELAWWDEGETKADGVTILGELSFAIADAIEALGVAYTTGGKAVIDDALEELNAVLGGEIILTDAAQLETLRKLGTRAGLVDLAGQTADAIFNALEEARAEGLAGDALARRIREHVESGPWRSVEIRARVIARTEGAFAANTSVIDAAREMEGVTMMMIHDNRAGHDDEDCVDWDNTPVSINDAEQLIADEHPNGTRSATPIPPLLAAEMGISL